MIFQGSNHGTIRDDRTFWNNNQPITGDPILRFGVRPVRDVANMDVAADIHFLVKQSPLNDRSVADTDIRPP